MDLKGEKALFEIGQRRKVIRGEDFPLNDREVDLHPIEPTGVGRGVDEDCIGPLSAEAINGPLAPMNGTVVHDPEDASRGLVGLLAHDFANQAIHRRDAILGLATTEELGAVDIPGSQVNPGAPAKVLVFHSRGTVRRNSGVECRLYDFRHTFATRFALAGGSLPVLAKILGHADLSLLMRYVHPSQVDVDRAMEWYNLASTPGHDLEQILVEEGGKQQGWPRPPFNLGHLMRRMWPEKAKTERI